MIVLAAVLALSAAPPASTPWEDEAAAIAAEEAEAIEGRTQKTAAQKEAAALFWTELGVAGGATALVAVAAAGAGTALVSVDDATLQTAGAIVFLATPLVASSIAAASAAAVMLLFERPLLNTGLVTGATLLICGFATAAGGAAGIALHPFLLQVSSTASNPLRVATAVGMGAALGMSVAAAASAALVPSFLASSYFVE